jgi:hypothetical protein
MLRYLWPGDIAMRRDQAMRFSSLGRMVKSGTPKGLTGEELNRGLAKVEDARHHVRGLFRFEWWYFDAVFDNGYSAVCILWPMNYFRPLRRQCSVMLSIYTPEGVQLKHYDFPPRRLFRGSYSTCDVNIGNNYVRGSHPRYEVHLESGEEVADLVFEAETPGWKPGNAVSVAPFPRYKTMGWLVPLPRAKVSGTLEVAGQKVEVEGHGYHDHNWGEAPLPLLIDNWHWGHIIAADIAIIWADITMDRSLEYDRSYMFLLCLGDRLVYESAQIEVVYEDWRDDPAYLHPYPAIITVSFGSAEEEASGEVTMRVQEVVETEDQLLRTDIPAFLHELVRRYLARPFYFRWRSRVEGWVEVRGKRILLEGDTVHEQMILRGRLPR